MVDQLIKYSIYNQSHLGTSYSTVKSSSNKSAIIGYVGEVSKTSVQLGHKEQLKINALYTEIAKYYDVNIL